MSGNFRTGFARPIFRVIILRLVALVLNCPLAQAQAPGQLPEFEVASIKPNKSNEGMYYGLRSGSLTIRNMPVMA